MRILILGGTGLIGRHLASHLGTGGHEPVLLIRDESKKGELPPNCHHLVGNPLNPGEWQKKALEVDGIVNLVGKNIMTRWTQQEKKLIFNTRIESTRRAVEAIAMVPDSGQKPFLINTSALGYYPLDKQEVLTEDDAPGNHFLAEVCKAWEEEAQQAENYGARVARTRFAPVLSPNGGLLGNILPVFKKGLGGKLGSGLQPFPWIHIRDLLNAIEFIAQNKNISGAVNLCSPQIINNKEFTRELAKALHRPAIFPVPQKILRLLYGELSQTLLEGPRVRPKVLQDNGFEFQFPEIGPALQDIVKELQRQA
ncbi:MAG: TIGR01777 family oxidoreductase [Thermodesulfobacteriota bacterium]